jgi:hypothetical protein
MSIRNHIQNARNNFPTTGFIKNDPIFKPFILTISNKSDTAISNLDVLGADTFIGNAGFTDGSLTNNGVTISSGMSEMNYEQFLYQCMQQPFSVSLTLIESIMGSNSQISKPFTLNTQDVNGNHVVRSIEPTFDPYQQESTIVVVKQNFSIDAFTKLNFSIVNGSTVFRIHFYPSSIINLAAGLQGSSIVNRSKGVLS